MHRDDSIYLTSRLQIILENMKTVSHMVEGKQPCNQILFQIRVIQHLLWNLKHSVIASQIQESITIINNNPNPKIQTTELQRLQELYIETNRKPIFSYEVKL